MPGEREVVVQGGGTAAEILLLVLALGLAALAMTGQLGKIVAAVAHWLGWRSLAVAAGYGAVKAAKSQSKGGGTKGGTGSPATSGAGASVAAGGAAGAIVEAVKKWLQQRQSQGTSTEPPVVEPVPGVVPVLG